jgi:hypothetical protein
MNQTVSKDSKAKSFKGSRRSRLAKIGFIFRAPGGGQKFWTLRSADRWAATHIFSRIYGIFFSCRGPGGVLKCLGPFDRGPAAKRKKTAALFGEKLFFRAGKSCIECCGKFAAKFRVGGVAGSHG